ncbi:MAG: DUF1329 domain-containing protein [Gammaproteobacteria bacterium]|nr:DUF1329 domain-containing protein [Gammaproteobacteria bacterium]
MIIEWRKLGWSATAGALACVLGQPIAFAAVTEQEAAKLGTELTPVGAEKKANADGSIPEWTGGNMTAPAGWAPGQSRPDPYAAEKPLYSIDASNVEQYKDKLSAGQIALINGLKGYRMDVYPTHRDCGYPDVVYERTKANATMSKMAANGYDIAEATPSGIPFPIPQSGAEAIWNHKLHWVDSGRTETYATIFSQPGGGSFVPLVQNQWTYTPFGDPKAKSLADSGGIEYKLLNEVVSPAARVGELILIHYYLAKTNDAWLYFPGQRRVRRSPTFAYDNPVPGYENLLMVDQYPMYSGATDRYDFKLVGKQELYIPYNTYAFNDTSKKFKDIFGPDYPKRELIRYELHRVWKIEGTVKPGMRHLFPTRTFYLDEDTWMMVVEDLYDAQGKVWRAMESYPYSAWELPACVYQGYTSYDLNVGRYMADNMPQEGKVDWLAGRAGKIDPKKFDANEMRREGDR